MRIAGRWQAALSDKANYVCACCTSSSPSFMWTYVTCVVIGPRSMVIVLCSNCCWSERDMGCDRNTNSSLDAPLGFRKKGRDDTLSSRPVNSSFRSSFFVLVFFPSPFSLWCRLLVPPILCRMPRSRKFRDYETRVSSKRKIRSRATFLSRVMREMSLSW